MDPVLVIALAGAAAREIRAIMADGKELTEEQIANIIVQNSAKIEASIKRAKEQMAKYGGETNG